jgi:hypothetical protein
MDISQSRPRPRSEPIPLTERREILYELLEIERARLREAVRIEKERRIVFPETTVILKDVQRLVEALSGVAGSREAESADPVDDLVASLRAEQGRG